MESLLFEKTIAKSSFTQVRHLVLLGSNEVIGHKLYER